MKEQRDPPSYTGWLEDRREVRAAAAGAVTGLGVFFLVRYLTLDGRLSALLDVLEVPFLLLSLSLLYGGYWLLRSDFCHRRVGRVAGWSVAGFLALVGIAVWLLPSQGLSLQQSAQLTLDVGAVGASSGLLVGLESERHYRRVDRDAMDATRAAELAEERFAFINRLLRHHLLNGMAVIQGQAELLAGTHDDPPEGAEIIRQRSDQMVDLVKNVETLGRAFAGDLPTHAVKVEGPLHTAVEAVRRERPGTDVRTDMRGTMPVVANDRIDLAFGALLRVAAEAARDDRMEVSAGMADGAVVVGVEFEGTLPGEEATTFDPGEYGDGDLRLFMAQTLIEYFGGTVSVPGEDGSGLSVRLPAAE